MEEELRFIKTRNYYFPYVYIIMYLRHKFEHEDITKKCRFKRHPRIYSGRAAAGKARKSWPLLRSDRSELPVLLLDVCKAPVEVPPAPSVSVRPAETGSVTPGTAC